MAYLKAPAGTRGPGSWPFLAREPCTRLVNSRGYKRARLQGRFGASNSSGSDNTGSSGDPEVQENLVKLLNEQVGANQGHTQSSAAETSSSPNSSGNPEVQNTLSKLVKLQVGAEQVKARAAEGSETLKQTAEEVCWPLLFCGSAAHTSTSQLLLKAQALVCLVLTCNAHISACVVHIVFGQKLVGWGS